MSRASCVIAGSTTPDGPGITSRPRTATLGFAHAAPLRQTSKARQVNDSILAMGSPVEAQGRPATIGRHDRGYCELAVLAMTRAGVGLGPAPIADEGHEERADHRGAEHAAHHEPDLVAAVVLAGVGEPPGRLRLAVAVVGAVGRPVAR